MRQTYIQISLLSNLNEIKSEELNDIISKLPGLQPIQLHHLLSQLYSLIRRTSNFQGQISPIIFKSFINQFSMSNEIYQFHFAIQLLLSFGLELFSSKEEESLLNQLLIVSMHPSLTISHRLLALNFLENIIEQFPNINKNLIEITPFDGPDTQEKKLAILNKTDLNSDVLLEKLRPLLKLTLKNNQRATNSFYRILYAFITRRNQMLYRVEELLIPIIFSSPKQHIRHCVELMNSIPKLAISFCHKIIPKILDPNSKITKNLEEFKEFVYLIDWIFKRADIDLDENQIVNLLNLVLDECIKTKQLCPDLLSCCTAALSKKTITPRVKETIKQILGFLTEQNFSDISLSSLAQIYLVALNTLEDDENIKRIFSEDYESNNNLEIVKNCSKPSPIMIKRIGDNEKRTKISKIQDKPYEMKLFYEVSIKDIAPDQFNEVFALILYFDSTDGLIHEEIQVAYLEKHHPKRIALSSSARINGPFTFQICAHFNDSQGSMYQCDVFHIEQVNIQDILLPIQLDFSDVKQICDMIMKHSDSMETHLCFKQFNQIDLFFDTFNWLFQYYNSDSNYIAIVIPPDRLLVSTVQIVNDFVNLHVLTNNYKIVPHFYQALKSK